VVELSSAAASEIKMIAGQQGLAAHWALRVAVKKTPEAIDGWMYVLDMIEKPPAKDDVVFDSRGVRIFVDSWSRPYLQGTTVDFRITPEGKGFTFHNPNAKSR
jgi:iron-sulfur cluster assembly protein